MRVVLIENVQHLGIVGDVKNVADGYARNYLLPNKLAVRTGDKEAKTILKNIAKKREKIQTEIKKVKKAAEDFKDNEIVFSEKVSKNGKLFAAIGVNEVAKKIGINKKSLEMNPIKETGEYKAKINFGHDIKKSVKIIVKAK